MNPATAHTKKRSQLPKREQLSDNAQRQVVLADDLRQRWERIVSGDRA